MSHVSFAELGLPSELVDVLSRKLITEPFDIQALAIPDALVGKDILGRAPTGSGTTLAFGLPMLARLEKGSKKQPRGLILSPTRELAEQICRELEPLAAAMDRNVLAVYGGTGLDRQIKALRRGVDVLVACPGRLLDLIQQRAVQLDEVDIVVVDEADRMADMGFLPDVRKLLDQTSDVRQTVLFSATLDGDVKVLTDKYQEDPVIHEVGEAEPDLSTMQHRFIKVQKSDRIWLSADVIADAGPTVVFCRTRHGVDRLARQLKAEGIKAGYIHGGRSQSQRDRALKVFVDGKVDALVATDVAARGIHVDGVACVIHYDPPAEIKDYVHRSGRTARAGAAGVVVSFLDGPQVKESQKMQRKLGLDAELEGLPERQPRSSRPQVVEDRREQAPAKSKRRSGPSDKRSDNKRSDSKRADSKRSDKKRTDSKRSDSKRSDSRHSDDDKRPRNRKRSDDRTGSRSEGGERKHRSGSGQSSERSSKRSDSRGDSRSESRSDSRSGSGSRSGSKLTSRRGAGPKPAGGKSSSSGKPQRSKPTGAKPAGGKTGGSKATGGKPSGGRDADAKPSKPRSRSASAGKGSGSDAPGGRKKNKSSGPTAGKAVAKPPKSKRSGKPRPKNRKNKPKTTGRR